MCPLDGIMTGGGGDLSEPAETTVGKMGEVASIWEWMMDLISGVSWGLFPKLSEVGTGESVTGGPAPMIVFKTPARSIWPRFTA